MRRNEVERNGSFSSFDLGKPVHEYTKTFQQGRLIESFFLFFLALVAPRESLEVLRNNSDQKKIAFHRISRQFCVSHKWLSLSSA
jgi:hypothetical protein